MTFSCCWWSQEEVCVILAHWCAKVTLFVLRHHHSDNLAANFSRELADYIIYVIDVAGGDKVPRKGGPGITQADLLVINKIDLAPHVGADLNIMDRDAKVMRGEGPTVFSQIHQGKGVDDIVHHVVNAWKARKKMAELSFFHRLVLTLLLSVLILFFYKWLQAPHPSVSHFPVKRSKKRNKKKPAKEVAASESLSPPPQSPVQDSSTTATLTSKSADDDDKESDIESDDGRSAAQVLVSRKFKPTSLGDSRLVVRDVKESLPDAATVRFSVDEKVLARFGGGDRWFPATVLERRKGNEYHLKYDDGEVEYRVSAAFIKPQPTKTDDDNKSDVQSAETEVMAEDTAHQEEASNADSVSSVSDDDGWQVVGTSTKKNHARRMQAAARAEPLVEGLTKRQRENRRKKERQREKKELLRQHAQKDDLDARARWRYVGS
ncbi:hypothetical protein PsorP6_001533 [Peronosclerospora sorghi]|uniref:Uncharacterized protein n=1 Tax=Peronosclerospora sorghi TaxID=230839 RepID=A0ACC0WWC2_9STRA|nr:hypothetical protein PsorP6_001533 [Peronosclerospora sorghi]